MRMLFSLLTLSFLALASCTTTPAGRNQLNLISAGQMDQLGDQSFEEMKKTVPISKDVKQNRIVQCITHRLLLSMGQNPAEWDTLVFKDENPNAFALPGKNIGVHTGMITLARNQDQLAAVIGHEIGHVLANHGNERVSHGLVTQAGLAVTSIALGESTEKNQMIMTALGLGAQFGILLPYGRTQESEADRLGIEYMAKAGFRPQEAVELWRVMAENSGGKAPPEFFSTHPSNATRIENLSELAPKFDPDYMAVKDKPRCI